MTSSGFQQDLARLREAWDAVPHESKVLRAALAAVFGLGVTVTAMRSMIYGLAPPIPWWWFPDSRPVALFVVSALVALYAAAGKRQRRMHLLYFGLLVVMAFHLEAATVHWFVEYNGSITGERVDLLGVGASVLALASVLVMHADVEAWHFADDLKARGVAPPEADSAGRALSRAGLRRVGLLAAAAAGLAVVVAVSEAAMGDADLGNNAYLALGAGVALLAAAAWFAVRAAMGDRA